MALLESTHPPLSLAYNPLGILSSWLPIKGRVFEILVAHQGLVFPPSSTHNFLYWYVSLFHNNSTTSHIGPLVCQEYFGGTPRFGLTISQ
jgi:hypothetical protein